MGKSQTRTKQSSENAKRNQESCLTPSPFIVKQPSGTKIKNGRYVGLPKKKPQYDKDKSSMTPNVSVQLEQCSQPISLAHNEFSVKENVPVAQPVPRGAKVVNGRFISIRKRKRAG